MDRNRGRTKIAVLLLTAIAIGMVVAVLPAHGNHDFRSYYAAAQILRSNPHHLYSLSAQWSAQQSAGNTVFFPWAHLAPEALLFVPLTFMSCSHAYAVWVLLNSCLFLVCAYLLADEIGAVPASSHYSLMAFCFNPVMAACLWAGQDHAIYLLLWVLTWRALKRQADFSAGFIVGLALIRYQFALPMLIFFLAMRKWRVLGGAAMTGIALLSATFAIVGAGFVSSYVHALRFLAGSSDSAGLSIMPTVRGFTAFLFPAHGAVAAVAASAGLLAWAAMKVRGLPVTDGFALAILVSFLVDPHAYYYQLPILVIPLVFTLTRYESVMTAWVFFLVAVAPHVPLLALCPFLLLWALRLGKMGSAMQLVFPVASAADRRTSRAA